MSEKKPRLLFIGDAVAPTGFARLTHNLLDRLVATWDVKVLGINYYGDPNPHSAKYHIYPASLGGDVLGIERTAVLTEALKPDVILIQNDAWLVPNYVQEIRQVNRKVPIVAYIPPDAPNQCYGAKNNELTLLITPTRFGQTQLRLGGYLGASIIIPYGVDTERYQPRDKAAVRREMGFRADIVDGFVIGRADRNAPRKRYDLSTQIFAEWWKEAGEPDDAYLYYHCALRDRGWDIEQLARYYGLHNRLILTSKHLDPQMLVPETLMPNVFNSWDVHFSTTLGEGWGLVTHESAACGVAQILPRYSALAEWMDGAATFVPCTGRQVTVGGANTIGGVIDIGRAITAIDHHYRDRTLVSRMGEAALARAREPQFSWTTIAAQFDAALKGVL